MDEKTDAHAPRPADESHPPAPVSVAPTATPSVPPASAKPPQAGPPPAPQAKPRHRKRRWSYIIGIVVVVLLSIAAVPQVVKWLNTVSTDDAYVNSHVTFVAPRVPGQVTRVLVDDNNRVHKGDLLLQLDKAPYQDKVNIAQAALAAAQADIDVARAQARSLLGQARSARFNLQHAIEEVDDQVAQLHARVATVQSQKAVLAKAQGDYDRARPLLQSGGVSRDEFAARTEALEVAKAELEEDLQAVYQQRVSLGLPAKPATGDDLTEVPEDLDQNFSSVREAQATLVQAAAQLGVTTSSFDQSPKAMLAEFYRRDPTGNIDRIYRQILATAPSIKQAQAKLLQAQRDLELAQLNLSYTDVYAEINGVVTHRNVNPGDNLVTGQSVMAIRSLTDTWIDANFKETQLRELRIGQPVDIDVDMYGAHHLFKGRISGFTFGTGSTLALLPAENATGNFVKVVQRLPVRIDILDYDADKTPLFPGLSVTPHVQINEPPTGPNAGDFLQLYQHAAPAHPAIPATGPAETQP